MKILCPRCHQRVPADQINISTDLAFCPPCNEGFKVSEVVDASPVNLQVLDNPPSGAWLRREADKVVVGVSTRSPAAFFLVPFMCVWSGVSLGGIYGTQIMKGQFNWGMSLFGIPFVLGSVLFWSLALMAICGKVEVTLGDNSSVFTGVGPLGWRRRFDWSAVQSIREESAGTGRNGGSQMAVILEGAERVKVAAGVSEKRRYFLLTALKAQLAERGGKRKKWVMGG